MKLTFDQLPEATAELLQRMGSIEASISRIAEAQKQDNEKLLSGEEARKLFSPMISKPTLIRWTAGGHLKAYRIGGRVFYRQSEVLQSATTLKKYDQK